MTPSQELLLVVIVAMIVFGRRNHDQWRRLHEELAQRMPVFSAETTNGKEAEFIRDRLPKRTSWVLYALAATLVVVVVVLRWWLG